MKKTLRIMLALALVIAALSVSVSAAGTNGFYDIGSADNVAISAYTDTNATAITSKTVDIDKDGTADEVYYEGSNRLGVTYSAATSGANYGVILVEGSSLPTASSAIYYINQVQANDTSVAFDVYPSDIAATKAAMTLYISSDAEGANLVSVPMAYVYGYEEVVEPEVTIMYGDVTGNGKHTVADLNRHALYWADPDNTIINEANADCTGNGKHTVADLNRHALYWADPDNTVLGPAK